MRRALLIGLLACSACARSHGCGDDSLAELIEVHGRGVERDFRDRVGRWQPAEIGARFDLGDGLRAAASAHAIVQLEGGSLVRLRPGTMLRFLAPADGTAEQGLDVQSGQAEISVGAQDMKLRTELGVALLERGSRVTLRRAGAQRIVYRVELGAARLQRPSGGHELVHGGELVEVGIGMAVLDRRPVDAPLRAAQSVQITAAAAPPAAPAKAAVTEADAESGAAASAAGADAVAEERAPGSAAAIGAGPERASVGVPAGESFTVHAARMPVAVAFEIAERCPGEALLLVDGKPQARGGAQVSAMLGAGRHGYELRCIEADGTVAVSARAGGHVTALRDAGSAPLPRKAPTSFVDADGKRYTVLFQNLLPRIELRWPNAPKSGGYRVHVESEDHAASERPARKPEYVFAAGALREGTHRLHFSSAEGASSRVTTLELRFDNAAPRASVTRPRDGAFRPGESVEVVGVALPGYKVSLLGGAVALDGQYRFSGSAMTTPTRPDIALRIESPRGGVHYYVRRAASAP